MFRIATTFGVALVATACMPTSQSSLIAAADPTLRVRDPSYSSVTAGVRNYEVTGPKDWIEQNRQVAPRSNPERGDSNDAARRGR